MVAGGGSKTLPLSRSGNVDLVSRDWRKGHWRWTTPSATKSRLSESLLGLSELASRDMVVGDNNIGGWWLVVGGLTAAAAWWL